jgi:hypothetical protein
MQGVVYQRANTQSVSASREVCIHSHSYSPNCAPILDRPLQNLQLGLWVCFLIHLLWLAAVYLYLERLVVYTAPHSITVLPHGHLALRYYLPAVYNARLRW